MTPMLKKNMLRLDKRREKTLSKREKFSKGISRKRHQHWGCLQRQNVEGKSTEKTVWNPSAPDSKAIAKKSSRSRARQVLSQGSAWKCRADCYQLCKNGGAFLIDPHHLRSSILHCFHKITLCVLIELNAGQGWTCYSRYRVIDFIPPCLFLLCLLYLDVSG